MSAAVELTVQSEKAFQKQPIFYNSKALRKATRDRRWYKDVGLGFKTPTAAINGQYIGTCRLSCAPSGRTGVGTSRLENKDGRVGGLEVGVPGWPLWPMNGRGESRWHS